LQAQKFDPQSVYIKRWVPEVDSDQYSSPIVEHAFARARAIATYKEALKNS
jgi:deoxyribodipyrimidine photo-lyase